jgi:hypothetical protein
MMRASKWRSLVMMPHWLPVKEMASCPHWWMAMLSSDMEIRSPTEISMSSSLRGGSGWMRRASAISSSVVLPMALTTTTRS